MQTAHHEYIYHNCGCVAATRTAYPREISPKTKRTTWNTCCIRSLLQAQQSKPATRRRMTGGSFASINVSDEMLGTFVPVLVYWVYSGFYALLGSSSVSNKYRLHSRKEEAAKNAPSKGRVVVGVMIQQAFQIAVSILLFTVVHRDGDDQSPAAAASLLAVGRQMMVAMVVMDTWQYFVHRYMHANKFLYRHIHSKHHSLVVPFAYGALYNHPLEGLLLDTVGGAASFLVSGMTPRTAIFFFSLATVKTVDDHCGMWIPGHPLQLLFSNNSAYHDVHHQLYGAKYNFSQPFFVMWDKMLGTYMPYTLVKDTDGGLKAKLVKD